MLRVTLSVVCALLCITQTSCSEEVAAGESLFDDSSAQENADPSANADASGSFVVDLTDDNFDALVKDGKEGPWFVEFYAPWCGHCKSLAPEWEQLANIVKQSGDKATIAKCDATANNRVSAQFEVQGFPTLKLIDQGKMYDYEGARTADALATWVAGPYKEGTAFNLPKDKTVIDNIKKNVKQMMDGAVQVQQFMPALLPSVFIIGIFGGFVLAYMCGFLRRSRIAGLNEQFDVKITRDEKGSAGMIIDPMTMMVMEIQAGHEQKLKGIKKYDTVIAVNKQSIIDSDDYRRLAVGVPEFTLTFARSGTPTKGTSSNGHKKAD